MPVTYGATTTVTGAGSWTYPDPSVLIGVKIEVDAVGTACRQWGTQITRYREIGVYALVDEAGLVHSAPLWNPTEVRYDIGHSPVSFNYDLEADTQITITEILSEAPPPVSGGIGASTLMLSGTQDMTGGPNQIIWDGFAGYSWSGTNTSGIVLPQNGVYIFTLEGSINTTGSPPNYIIFQMLNGDSPSTFLTNQYVVEWPSPDLSFWWSYTTHFGAGWTVDPSGTRVTGAIGAIGAVNPVSFSSGSLVISLA